MPSQYAIIMKYDTYIFYTILTPLHYSAFFLYSVFKNSHTLTHLNVLLLYNNNVWGIDLSPRGIHLWVLNKNTMFKIREAMRFQKRFCTRAKFSLKNNNIYHKLMHYGRWTPGSIGYIIISYVLFDATSLSKPILIFHQQKPIKWYSMTNVDVLFNKMFSKNDVYTVAVQAGIAWTDNYIILTQCEPT